MSEKEEHLGLTIQDAKTEYEKLKKQLDELAKKVKDAKSRPLRMDLIEKYSKEIETLEQKMNGVTQDYTVGLLESLNTESKRLNTLTKALIGLTVVLGFLTAIDILSKVIFHI